MPTRRRVGQALLATGCACVGALHVLHAARGDLAPWEHRLSEYANGTAGGLMTAAFVTLGLALVVLASVVVPRRRLVAIGMTIAGAGLVASGAFPTGVAEAGATSDALHGLASSVATVAMTAVVVLSGRRALAAVAVVLAVASPSAHSTVVAGLDQRLLWATLLLWCALAARAPRDVSVPSAPAPTMAP